MKKFSIPCEVDDQTARFDIYLGEPAPDVHPLKHQAEWLLRERNAIVPNKVMESFRILRDVAVKHGVSFEDLCMYALGTDSDSSTTESIHTGTAD